MPRAIAGVLTAALLVLVGADARAETVREDETSTTFTVNKSFGGTPHVLLGVGAREVTAFKVNIYGAGLYVGVDRAKAAWRAYMTGRFAKAGLVTDGTPDLARISRHAVGRHFLVYGRFPKAMEMAFVRDAPGDRIVEGYEDNWKRLHVDRTKAGEALTRFMDVINYRIAKGERMVVRTNGNTIVIEQPRRGATKIKGNRTFVTALWQIYFGNPCPQPTLRDQLLSGFPRLNALTQ